MSWKQTFFPDLVHASYLNHAAIAPLSTRVTAAMRDVMAAYVAKGSMAWPEGFDSRDRLREKLAQLIHCRAIDIGLVSNTTHGLMVVANEFPWQPGDALVLIKGEFPGNVVPWLAAAKAFGVRVIWLTLDDLLTQSPAFHDAVAANARLIAVSWVQYQTGRVMPLQVLSQLRQTYGVQVCVDAIQGLGPLTMDLTETPVDYVACGGHKWLLGAEGAGFLYVHPQRMAELEPRFAGWISQEQPFDFLMKGGGLVDYHRDIRKEANRYEMGTMNTLGFAGLGASIAMILEVGPELISERVLALAQYCRDGLRELGLTVFEQGATSGNASFLAPEGRIEALFHGLKDRGVIISSPDGYIRAAPHFYNDEADIQRYLDALRELL